MSLGMDNLSYNNNIHEQQVDIGLSIVGLCIYQI